jgi:hypothetical protein
METWELEKLPDGFKALPMKWVYKFKRYANRNIERYKACLMAKGYLQKQGVDFEKVYAPVSKHTTLRALLAVVAAWDMELHQLDVKTAFLNGELNKKIYMQQAQGYEDGGRGWSTTSRRRCTGCLGRGTRASRRSLRLLVSVHWRPILRSF